MGFFKSTLGEIVIQTELAKEFKDTTHGMKFWDIMSKIAVLITIAVGTIQIGQIVWNVLPEANSVDTEIEIIDESNDINEKSNKFV